MADGAKDMMGTNKRIIRARGHEFLAEDEGNRTRISIKIDGAWEHATTVNSDNQTAAEWIEANAKPGDPSRWLPSAFSRPGKKDTMAVEDRFYFGKKGGLGKSVFGGWTMDFGAYKMLIGRIEAAAKKLPLVGLPESDALINESRGVIETVVSTLKAHRNLSGSFYPMERDKIRSLIQSAIKKLPVRKLETLDKKAVDRYYNFGDALQRRKNPAAEKAYQVSSKIGDQLLALKNLVKYLETIP